MPDLPTPADDGLYISEVGEWSHDKHYFLERYINAFTTSMKNKNWAGLHYIDLFADAGVERIRDSGTLEWGSPMIAARTRYKFQRLHLCEKDMKKYQALDSRVKKLSPNAQVLNGDANEKIVEIIKTIPDRTLSLAFLDPYGLHLEFETLKRLSKIRADLIIFFPDYLDALRNWECNYLENPDSNLDRCLGKGADWRSIIEKTPTDKRAEVLRKLYVQQIAKLGYNYFEYERISTGGHPLYVLILCSQHQLAAKLWQGISGTKPDGQRTFKFD